MRRNIVKKHLNQQIADLDVFIYVNRLLES